MQHGYRAPANGMVIAALEDGLKKPGSDELICEKVVVGKPNPNIIDLIMKQHGIDQSEKPNMLMIGDNPATDIALGKNAGIDTCLVLSGVVKSEKEAHEWIKEDPWLHEPTYVIKSIGEK